MKKRFTRFLLCAAILAASAAANHGCASLADIASTMTNLQRLKFRVASVSGFAVAGIGIAKKQRLADFTVMDGINLLASYKNSKLPASFTLNIEAVNPNDGTGGSTKTVSTLTSFAWRLLIDGKQTVAGDITQPVEIPGTGQASIIPLRIELDLVTFFKEKGYDDLINLALALGGMKSDITRLALDAQPRVSTPLGEITYPGRITVVSKEYR
jgi:hypothetical protein